jgi:predicted restriction endonuclease
MTDEEVAQRWEKAQAVQQELKDRERARRHKLIPKAVRQKVYEKYDGHCAYCGKPIEYKEMQVDHIQAHYLGGADEMDNYNPACRMCNFYKGTMSIDRFREELRKLQERLKKVYIYRLALRYGLVEEKENKVVFYFESKEREKGE